MHIFTFNFKECHLLYAGNTIYVWLPLVAIDNVGYVDVEVKVRSTVHVNILTRADKLIKSIATVSLHV